MYIESISVAYAAHATVSVWADMQSVAWVIVDWIHTDCEEGSLIPAVRRRLDCRYVGHSVLIVPAF